jgi:hypothetical protein
MKTQIAGLAQAQAVQDEKLNTVVEAIVEVAQRQEIFETSLHDRFKAIEDKANDDRLDLEAQREEQSRVVLALLAACESKINPVPALQQASSNLAIEANPELSREAKEARKAQIREKSIRERTEKEAKAKQLALSNTSN